MFTKDEIAVIKPPLEGAVIFTHALVGLGNAIGTGLTTASRPALMNAARHMVRSARDVTSGVPALIGALPLDLAGHGQRLHPTPLPAVPETSRSAQLDYAWLGPPYGIQRACDDTLLEAAKALVPVDATGQHSTFGRLGDLVLGTRAALLQIDRAALLHSDPPPGGTFGDRRTTIGPHGDYYTSAHYLQTTMHYMNDWADEGFLPVLSAIAPKYREPMAGAFRLYGAILADAFRAMALDAGIPLYTPWESLPEFPKGSGNRQFSWTLTALWLKERAIDMNEGSGIPELFKSFGHEWLSVLPGTTAATRPAWAQGMEREHDAWARMDNSSGNDNHFPDRRAG